ncbi:uncharacterized protein LOC143432533 [Xylocopa sonorina]|uniref:uncharacterized protein LOC143432533 n=1 Tax=Xylocopa sonorina TaxID=1818115 RepID=UPI00403B2BD6
MNDSFLEDLELVSTDIATVKAYQVDRHVTTRTATSSPLNHLSHVKRESASVEKELVGKESKDLKKLSDHGAKKQQMKVRISERKEKSIESKLKPIENKVNSDDKEQDNKDDAKAKLRDSRLRISESRAAVKDRARRSGSCKENAQTLDVLKENSRPSDGLKEGTSQVEAAKDKTKIYDIKKAEPKELDTVTLLNAIKNIVSTCTKQESTKILRAMQDLHLNSQANLIKHLLLQTDDIVNEMHPDKDLSRAKGLIEQNKQLQKDIVTLQTRNMELQKKLEELEYVKQENVALKMKCKELSKQ